MNAFLSVISNLLKNKAKLINIFLFVRGFFVKFCLTIVSKLINENELIHVHVPEPHYLKISNKYAKSYTKYKYLALMRLHTNITLRYVSMNRQCLKKKKFSRTPFFTEHLRWLFLFFQPAFLLKKLYHNCFPRIF